MIDDGVLDISGSHRVTWSID